MKKFKVVFVTALLTTLLIIVYANLRNPKKELEYQITDPTSAGEARFVKTISDLLDPDFTEGNRIETLLNGDEIFPAMLGAIRSAQKTISFESYIYWSGEIGKRFAEALAERAQNGVTVHVLLDWAGSGRIDDEIIEIMTQAGVEVERYHAPRWYNITRMNNRTHRKVLVVDGQVGFTGGVGIADEWTGNGRDPRRWRDTHFRVEGPVVNQMQAAFMDNWLKVKPNVRTGDTYFPVLPARGRARAQMFISSASEGGASVRIMYLMAIGAARKSIHLESAYFVPDDHTIEQLVAARKRGVDIEIIVPGEHNDSEIVDSASRESWGKLLEAGVKIYRYQPAMFHCKVLVVDGIFSSVGSTNFDERSFRLNDEANLNVFDQEFAEQQLEIFARDREQSHPVSLGEWANRPFTEKALGKFSQLISSQL